MSVVILIQSAVDTTSFEHGLELAMTMADMEMEVQVLFASDAADNLIAFSDDSAKKAGQLNLFDIKCSLFTHKGAADLHESLGFIQITDKEKFRDILAIADKVVRF